MNAYFGYKLEGSIDLVSVTYEFLEPSYMVIKKKDETITTINYGITERIQILEPKIQNLVVPQKMLSEILMPNGDIIIDWDKNVKMRRI